MGKIFVTGGAGYVGSHCTLALLEQGYDVLLLDNLSTGHIETVETLRKLGNVDFIQGDINDSILLDGVFSNNDIDAVMHFAAFSQVGESVKNPAKYYRNNVAATINLLSKMVEHNIKKIVFN